MSFNITLNRNFRWQTDKASKIKSIPNEIQISPNDDTRFRVMKIDLDYGPVWYERVRTRYTGIKTVD